MALPDTAEPYWRRQQSITATAVATALRAWQGSGGTTQWESIVPFIESTVMRAQAFAASNAGDYVQDTLHSLGVDVEPIAVINPEPLIGVSGNGLSLSGLYSRLPVQMELHTARIAALAKEPAETVFRAALTATGKQLAASVQTIISDTGRAAESLHIVARPHIGYVRMVNKPACSRCIVQAGKYFKWNAGFKRHPNCDCRHIPVPESLSGDLRVNTGKYFQSLSQDQQDTAFGKAGAQAIRDGADLSQVVNADAGMRAAQVYGKNLRITDSGVTKRGFAGQVIKARGRNAATTPRLMPSSIYQIAEDRQDAIRLLRLNGYILPDGESTHSISDLLNIAS